jgi:FkbM family methyltransferase
MNEKILIDIGCFNAKTNSITYKLLNRKKENWKGYLIEPNYHLNMDIINNLENCNFNLYNYAISNKNEKNTKFYLGKYGFNNYRDKKQMNKCMRSSLCIEKDYVKQHLTNNFILVECMKLKDFIEFNKIKKIDLLKIDTEGHDYEILLEYFNNDNIIYPLEIITEDIVKNKEEDHLEQLEIKEKKINLLNFFNYKYTKLDEYNSKFILV